MTKLKGTQGVRFSSLYIGILAATQIRISRQYFAIRFSSLYIGILAATLEESGLYCRSPVSVPFTSGSSLQPTSPGAKLITSLVSVPFTSGSSLQLAPVDRHPPLLLAFQFPLHRDPRCNAAKQRRRSSNGCFSSLYIGILAAT